MKVKEGFLVKKILDDYIVVPTGDTIIDFAVAVSLNESGAFLWEELSADKTEEDLVKALLSEFEGVDEATAKADVAEFILMLSKNGFLES